MPETSRHLAERIEARRQQLGLNPTQLAAATGLSPQGLKNIRKGAIRKYQERLTLPLTRVLGWTPDSIDRLLAGEEPVELVRPSGDVESRVESLEHRIEELTVRLAEVTLRVGLLSDGVQHGARVRRAPRTSKPASGQARG